MKFNQEEIALCKKLHELGVRKEIKEGDYALSPWARKPHLVSFPSHLRMSKREFNKRINDPAINKYLLWTWADAREWLKQRRYSIHLLATDEESQCAVRKGRWGKYVADETGNKDEIAILKCMVEVAQSKIAEKGGKG